jgi:hypothetical protein
MTRRPRKPDEHLVSACLLGHAYGNMGELATCGGFFTYNVIMNNYGFPFSIYFELLSASAVYPSSYTTFPYTPEPLPPSYSYTPDLFASYKYIFTYPT